MINGVRVRDSGVELSPPERTVGEARERHPTARFELLRQSRPDRRDGSCGGPNGHFRPLRRTGPPMATHGHLWPPLYSQVAHCYALVKTSTRGTAQGLPAAFPGFDASNVLPTSPIPASTFSSVVFAVAS